MAWNNAVKLAAFMEMDDASLHERMAVAASLLGIFLSGIPVARREREIEDIFNLIRTMTDVASSAAPGVLPI